MEKYGDIDPEDDDEIDLVTGKVVKIRGRLKKLIPRDFGEVTEDEEEEEVEGSEVFTFDDDEDELGAWDERSGLDDQGPGEDEEEENEMRRPWTMEDDVDLQAFLRAESIRKEEARERGEESEEEDQAESGKDSRRSSSPGLDLRNLFREDSLSLQEDSEDELLAQTSEAEEATRVEVPDTASEDEDDVGGFLSFVPCL